MKTALPVELKTKYNELQDRINARLIDYASVPEDKYFYELCFCVMTPQSRAAHAFKVQQSLEEGDFMNKPFDPTHLLRNPSNYIRFHNQKAARLLKAREIFHEIDLVLKSDLLPIEKRNWLADNFKGFGMKESSHFLRNIGYRGLAILDRHILKHLSRCGLYSETPKITNTKRYLEIETDFLKFASEVNISIDELDLLFWSYETGEILK